MAGPGARDSGRRHRPRARARIGAATRWPARRTWQRWKLWPPMVTPAARLALDVYVHRLRAAIAAMVSAMGGIDAVTFTGGVGEKPRLRDRGAVDDGLSAASRSTRRRIARSSRTRRSPDAFPCRRSSWSGLERISRSRRRFARSSREDRSADGSAHWPSCSDYRPITTC